MPNLVYLKLKQQFTTYDKRVRLKDICGVMCSDTDIKKGIEELTVVDFADLEGRQVTGGEKAVKGNKTTGGEKAVEGRQVVDILDVICMINETFSDVTIENIGQTDCVVELKRKHKSVNILKAVCICILTFTGGCYGIMAYNNDVGTIEIFQKMYVMFRAESLSDMNIIEVCYAVGLFLGIVIFYDHFAGFRISDAPTPIEVEMDKYDADIATSVISREGENDN